MATRDLEEGSLQILKDTLFLLLNLDQQCSTFYCVWSILFICKINICFYSVRGDILGRYVEGSFYRLFAEKF